MHNFLNWLDNRTGWRKIVNEALYEHIPGGARWRYVWGSTLAFTFFVQLITGLFLWSAYNPSTLTAWESVYNIQHVMTGGWLLRAIHHFTAQAMVLLMVVHVFQVVIDSAYKAPREINFWLGLILMKIVLALALTGYLLPWDQKGYYGTKVATEIANNVPIVGPSIQTLLVGGTEYGHQTLSRFFMFHAGLLPGLLIFFLILHIAMFRRHRLKVKEPYKKKDAYFWPGQILKDGVACFAVLAVILFFSVRGAWDEPAAAGAVTHLGAELGSPADPAVDYSAARPEWYFLFLFQFLKYFGGDNQIWGTLIFPGLVMLMLFLMPFVGRWKLGHRFNISLLVALSLGVAFLTTKAMMADHVNPVGEAGLAEDASDAERKAYEHYTKYQEGVAYEHWKSDRVVTLAQQGIPARGAISLLRNDPKTQGARLFETHCASCHTHSAEGVEFAPGHRFTSDEPNASNLYRFGSKDWVLGLLDPEKIASSDFLGATTAHADGEMVSFVADMDLDEDTVTAIAAALAADSGRPDNPTVADDILEAGREAIADNCAECHKYGDEGELGSAPDLTGYGSRQWMIDFVSNPQHERFYEYVDAEDKPMPAYLIDPHDPAKNTLRLKDIELIVDFIRGDWYEPAAASSSEEAAAATKADDEAATAEAADTDSDATEGSADSDDSAE